MAKKDKLVRKSKEAAPAKKVNVPKKSIGQSETPVTSQPFLILFDKKTKIFVFALLALYFILSISKIHTSNIANWDIVFGLKESESVISGEPRYIRMDEWMVSTPAALGQYNAGLPISNQSLGDLNAPVVWGLPVKDISSALRPSIWSYFIFDIERAFAFSWNFNIFFFLISTFLLLMLLTRNKFWLSVTGTFFIFLSGGLQWWSYYIGIYMLYLNGMFISVAYLLYNRNRLPLILAAGIFILSVFGFIFNLYPPFQVPLVYLYTFLFIGFLLQRKNFTSIKEEWQLRAIVFSVAIVILGFFILHYYNLVKDTYAMILNTVYPGNRVSIGGSLKDGKLFADFFTLFITDTNFPKAWLNICEASGFIMFFPIVFYAIGYYFIKTKKTDPMLICLSVFVIIGLLYVLVGFPTFLSKLTLFSMSPDYRALPIIGAGNCFLLICYLSSNRLEYKNEKISWVEFGVLAALIFVFMRIVSSLVNKATENFFTPAQVNIATALIMIAYLLARYKNFQYAKPALYFLLIGMTIRNLNVHPLTKGLGPILDNPLIQASSEIHKKDPAARWAVFGSVSLTNLIKATGINMLNAVKFVPPMKDMKVLDPTGANAFTYNRYAWMTMATAIANDTVVFQKTFNEGYTIHMDPCSPKLKQLNVKYIVFDYVPKPEETRCMTKISELGGIVIYKRNDQ